jgi:hypothetical protein
MRVYLTGGATAMSRLAPHHDRRDIKLVPDSDEVLRPSRR